MLENSSILLNNECYLFIIVPLFYICSRESKKLKQDTDNELYHTQWSSYSQQQWGGGNYQVSNVIISGV